jgi:hypothetical protein
MPSLISYDDGIGRIPKDLQMTSIDDADENNSDRRPRSASRMPGSDGGRALKPAIRPAFLRAKSDLGPRDSSQHSARLSDRTRVGDDERRGSGEQDWVIRHGFDTQLASEEQMYSLNSVRTHCELGAIETRQLTG